MLSSEKFEVTIFGTHGLVIPQQHALPFVDKGLRRVRVLASFEGKQIEFHGTLLRYSGNFTMSFGKRYQKQLGVFVNDYFQLQLFEDSSKYGVEMPEEFQAVLESDPEAMSLFENFTPGKKRSLIYYVLNFKNSQTRIEKALIISENLKMGIVDGRELIKDRR